MRLSFPIVIFFVFLIDQVSKWWVVECLIRPEITPERYDASATPFLVWLTGGQNQLPYTSIDVLPFFNIVMVWNKGISFGMFNDPSLHGPLLLTCLSAVIAVLFAAWLWRTRDVMVALSLSLIIGGALGNILDRLRFGAVADFLDLHAFGWHWPAFNVADSAITIGIAILLIHSLFFEPKSKEAVST